MDFLRQMQSQGVTPLEVTADHVKCYKRALLEAGMKSATVARRLSVLRGTYKQLATKGLVSWETAQDIAAVKAPGVQKNSTLSLTERQAISLLEAIPTETLQGIRDLALMSVLLVDERLPRVELSELLVEVDGWTGFSGCLEHAGGREPRSRDLTRHLYAAILAQGCNLGLTRMAQISDRTYDRLAWCTTWYLREETLRAAVAKLVNYQHRQPQSRYWGGGTLSSSDGQRFPAAGKVRNAAALPRYFGYGKGVTFYTWTSDQFAIRRRQEEEQVHQATCLNLLTNAVITWNTLYMAAVLDQLGREGHAVQDSDLACLSPCRYEHINPYGKYAFEVSADLRGAKLRPLRSGGPPA